MSPTCTCRYIRSEMEVVMPGYTQKSLHPEMFVYEDVLQHHLILALLPGLQVTDVPSPIAVH